MYSKQKSKVITDETVHTIMTKVTQAEKGKLFVQCILEYQLKSEIPPLITEILDERGATPDGFEALQTVLKKSTLTRVDLYSLIFPYNNTEHGKIISMHLGGLRCKKHVKASVRNIFSQLVCREKIMNKDPVLIYNNGLFTL